MVANIITKDLIQDLTSQHELAAMFKTQVHDLQSLTLDFFRFRKPKNKFTKSSPSTVGFRSLIPVISWGISQYQFAKAQRVSEALFVLHCRLHLHNTLSLFLKIDSPKQFSFVLT